MSATVGAERTAFYLGVFLVAAAIQIRQTVETRILSVVSRYHAAFFIVGLATFGMTAGALASEFPALYRGSVVRTPRLCTQ